MGLYYVYFINDKHNNEMTDYTIDYYYFLVMKSLGEPFPNLLYNLKKVHIYLVYMHSNLE